MIKLRNYRPEDEPAIRRLNEQFAIKFDVPHVVSILVIADEDDNCIGYGSLVSILECTFLVDEKEVSLKNRVSALTKLLVASDIVMREQGYDSIHSFSKS